MKRIKATDLRDSELLDTVYDIEGDNLYKGVTKIWVLSYIDQTMSEPKSIYGKEAISEFFKDETRLFIGHYIFGYDLPTTKKLYDIDYSTSGNFADTLPLSWYLQPERPSHGLDGWGETFGIKKPKVTDWENLSIEDYTFRCQEDVKINWKLWKGLKRKLHMLYGNVDRITEEQAIEKELHADAMRLIKYFNFKIDCLFDQYDFGWRLDIPKAEALFDKLSTLETDKVEELRRAMPKQTVYKRRVKPEKSWFKKDGSLSSYARNYERDRIATGIAEGVTWFDMPIGEEDGNPKSHAQIKDWLESLGWKPCTWKFSKHPITGEDKAIPQVRKDGELTPSVEILVEKYPELEALQGLTVISHRLGIVKAFLDCVDDEGYLEAGASGLTNTFRLKHAKPLVNLPGVDKPYGKDVRGCLIAPEGYELCGSDMVSLEDTTKRHYMRPIDPDYVAEMLVEGYDPHLSLALFAGEVTQEDYDFHAWADNAEGISSAEATRLKALKAIRKGYKVVNYSAVYGIMPKGLSRSSGMSIEKCKELLDSYWKKNYSVKIISSRCTTKEMGDGSMWLKNPVSRFWHSLRYEKDRFSTLNQSTGVFCFDMELVHIRAQGVKVIGQFHDEHIDLVPLGEGEREKHKEKLLKANEQTNEVLGLNVPLGVDVQFGDCYADIH